MRIKADGRSVRCTTGRSFVVAVPAHNDSTKLAITRTTSDADSVLEEVWRLARTRLATATVYVFKLPNTRPVQTLDEDDLARIAIKEHP